MALHPDQGQAGWPRNTHEVMHPRPIREDRPCSQTLLPWLSRNLVASSFFRSYSSPPSTLLELCSLLQRPLMAANRHNTWCPTRRHQQTNPMPRRARLRDNINQYRRALVLIESDLHGIPVRGRHVRAPTAPSHVTEAKLPPRRGIPISGTLFKRFV